MVWGIYHPDPVKDPDYLGPEFREDEVDKVEKLFLGKPVLSRHDPNKVIGQVMGFGRGPDGHLACKLFIDTKTPNGVLAYKEVENAKLRGLSITYDFKTNTEYSKFTHMAPLEISLVDEGAFDDTFVLYYGKGNELNVSRRGMDTLCGNHHNSNITNLNTMDPAAAAATTTPAAPPAMPPALEPTEEYKQFEAFLKAKNLDFAQIMKQYPELEKLQKEKMEAMLKERDHLLNDPQSGLLPYAREKESIPEGLEGSLAEMIMMEPAAPVLRLTADAIGTARYFKAKYEESQQKIKDKELQEAQQKEASSMMLRTEADLRRPKPSPNAQLEEIRKTISLGLTQPAYSSTLAPIAALAQGVAPTPAAAEVSGRSVNSAGTQPSNTQQAPPAAAAAAAPAKPKLTMDMAQLRQMANSMGRVPVPSVNPA